MQRIHAGRSALAVRSGCWFFVAGFCLALICGRAALAQEGTPPPPVAESPPVGDDAAAVEPAKEAPPTFLYIPFQDLRATINDLNASVMVPLAEYLKLKQAQAAATEPKPASAVITSAEYTTIVEKDLARIHAVLTVNVLGRPWVEVPLTFGDAAVGKLVGEDPNILLRGNGDGSYTLLFGAAGQHRVELDLVTRVHALPDGRQIAFTTPAVAVTTFDLQIPDADQTVEIAPRQVSLPVEAAEGTHVRASVGATATIVAKWYPRASSKPQMELLASAATEEIVSIDEGLLHRDAWIRFDVLRGQIAQIRLAVPKGNRVLDVSGDARIRGWKATEEGNRQIVTVDLLSPSEQPVQLEIHTESALPDGAFAVAGLGADGEAFGIHALDVVRETGQVAIRAASGLALTIVEQQSISRVDAAQTKERLRGDGVPAFQFFSPNFVLRAEVKAIEPRLVVQHAAQLVFHDDELRMSADLAYTIERAGVFELRVKLPDNLVVDDVQCPAMKEFRVDEPTRTLIVTLAQKTQGQTTVSLRGHRAFSAATDMTEQTLPLVKPLNVDRELGTIHVFAKEAIDVITNEAGIVAAQPAPAPRGLHAGDARLTSAWTFTRRPVSIPVKTVRKPVRLSADVATAIDVQPQLTEVSTRLTFLTEYAGLDTFRFMIPEGVSDRARIEAGDSSVAIRQKTPAAAENGWVTWTVVMQREVLGHLPITISYDVREAAAAGNAAATPAGPLTVRVVRPLGTKAVGGVDVPLTRVTGQVAVSKDDSLAVATSATGGDVEPIDVRELTLLPQSGASAFRYFRQPDEAAIEVTLSRTRNEVQPVVATVVRRGLVEVVAGDKTDAAATFRCRFRVKTSERQRLLVHLPVNLELLGAFVNGRDVRLEKADIPSGQKLGEQWDAFWLNVAREGGDDQEFVVAFQFLWKLTPPLGGASFSRGGLELPLPIFGPKDAPAAIQEQRVAVWVPREFILVGEPEEFVLINRPDVWARVTGGAQRFNESELDAWFGEGPTGSMTSLPREGRVAYVYSNVGGAARLRADWWRHIWATWLVSVAVAVIAIVLLRTSWENKLGMLLVGAFLLALYALQDRYGASELLAAGRFGLAFLLLLWVIHGLLSRRPATVSSTPPSPPPPPPAAAPAAAPGGP